MGVSPNYGYRFGGPYNKDDNMLGFPHFGKLPYRVTYGIYRV